MSIWSWFRRQKGSSGASDHEAAAILNALLDGNLTPKDARARWPRGKLSEPSAKSYIEYFEEGIDGRGTRDPSVDRMVRNLATILERGGGKWNERTEGWDADGGPVDQPREARDVYVRMSVSVLVFLRSNAEANNAPDEAAGVAAESSVLGDDKLEPIERAIIAAPFAGMPKSLMMQAHWRIEVAGALAWALGLIDAMPASDGRFDYARLAELIPIKASAIEAGAASAKLRAVEELLAMRARLRKERVSVSEVRIGREQDRESSLRNSRVLERFRALQWLMNREVPSLEATSTTPGT